jgi:nitric oxide dioxygenase
MSPSQIRLLQQSFALIEPIKFDVGRSFFAELFRLSPQTQSLFGDDLDQRWLRLIGTFQTLMNSQLRSMLTLPATATHSKEAVTPEVTQLAQGYLERGFTPEHMTQIHHALLASLSAHLGNRFDKNIAAAWSQFIGLVINSMRQTMSRDSVEQALPNEQGRTFSRDSDNAMDLLFAKTKPMPATLE